MNLIKIGTTLAQFCSFPANPYLLYLVQSKFCNAAVSHLRKRLSLVRKVVVLTLLMRIYKTIPTAGSPLSRSNSNTIKQGQLQEKAFLHVKVPNVKKQLKNNSGEANYFSTVVFIFITVLLLAFIIDLFGIISTKQQLDHCADQMVKQIQLSGGTNGETDALFQYLCSQINGANNITYTIDASYKSPTPGGMSRAIQLGSPFYITITGDARLGGFWNFNLVNIRIVSRGAGVSEHYWK